MDPAILRPGRIDRKIQYKLATKQQAIALFNRFYPESHTALKSCHDLSPPEKTSVIQILAEKFAEGVPEHEFSTAELQGYLLTCKKEPEQAAEGVSEWVTQERKDRTDRELREAERKAKNLEARDKRDASQLQGSLARLGIVASPTAVGQQLGPVSEPIVTMTANMPPIPDREGPALAPILTQPAHLLLTGNAGGPNACKPTTNGTTHSALLTPPLTSPNLP